MNDHCVRAAFELADDNPHVKNDHIWHLTTIEKQSKNHNYCTKNSIPCWPLNCNNYYRFIAIMTTVLHLGHFILILIVNNRFYSVHKRVKISATYAFCANAQGKGMNLIFPGLYLFPNKVALELQIIIQI